MIFLPPPIGDSSQSGREKLKGSVRRERRFRERRLRDRPGLGKLMRNQLSTTQGMSTLKIVLIFSVLGMILSWILPGILQYMDSEMVEDDARYYGTLGALCITGFFLVISLVRGIIVRNRRSERGRLESDPLGTEQSVSEDAEHKG